MNEKQRLTKMYMPLYAACGFTAGGFVLFIFSFSSPYWLESYSYVHSSFLHMGIWSVCFNKFIHPQVRYVFLIYLRITMQMNLLDATGFMIVFSLKSVSGSG